MRLDDTFKEARRIHKLGGAIIWLYPRDKAPIGSGWTTGPRKSWESLELEYYKGVNVGIRLGSPSKIGDHYLAAIDVDVKSTLDHHRKEALKAAKPLLQGQPCPVVLSGRGGGSRHYYCMTAEPFKTWNPAHSDEWVKYYSPSKKISKRDRENLSEKELGNGYRWGRAWEISLYSDGRQVVLPPSIHPDSGEMYAWKSAWTEGSDLPVLSFENGVTGDVGNAGIEVIHATGDDDVDFRERQGSVREANPAERSDATREMPEFEVTPVDLGWLPISDEIRSGIVDGTGVEDRSGYLLKASAALLSAELTVNEVLTVLTDPKTFLGACGYEHARTKDRAKAAAWIYRYTLKKVSQERSASNVFGGLSIGESRTLTEAEMSDQADEFEEMHDWRQDLVRGQNGGPPQKLVQNVVLILKNSVSPKVVKRDEFAYRDTYDCNTPWGGKKDFPLSDDEVAKIKYWLGVHWRFEPNNNVISDALTVLACQNAFDPVKDLLDGLPAWDETPRLDTWLSDHFGATGEPEYLAQVFRKWMVAMILRVYEPGAKFDWMPIFEGAQGIGKSSFGRLLVGDKYFLDWLPNLNDKDSALSLQGMWGVEMGELSQFRRNELENIKAFITRTVDKLRPPYGRRLIESPRRCVFFGTTNRETYLIDDTGNRRFKPVVVGNLDFEALRSERVQLFAEAKWLYDQKRETERTLDLDGVAKAYEKKIQGEKMVEDDSHAMELALEDFVEKVVEKKVVFDLKEFRILDLFQGVGPLRDWRQENKNLQFAAKMLRRRRGQWKLVKGLKYWNLTEGGGFDLENYEPHTLDKTDQDARDNGFF